MSKVDLVGPVCEYLASQRNGQELSAVSDGKGGCKITPSDSRAKFYDADIWFGRLHNLAKQLKAKIELHVNRVSGGGRVTFLGRSPQMQTNGTHLTLTSPRDTDRWEHGDYASVCSWYFIIKHK